MGDIGASSAPESPTTLDVTLVPRDELSMTFSSAASASNTSSNFLSQTKGPNLFALSSAGITVSGILVDDPSTITAPFLPGDTILACLIPPAPCLLSAHEDELRLRVPTISALELPGNMSPETGCGYFTALMIGAAILKQELHIPITRTPSASPNLAEDSGVGSYNDKRILVIGGETEMGAAMVQVLHRALPESKISVILDQSKQRTRHIMGLGAACAIDGAIDDLVTNHLSPSFDIIINTVKDSPVREDVMGTLDGMKRFLDCGSIDVEAAVARFLEEESDCVTSLHEMLLKAADVFDEAQKEPAVAGICDFEAAGEKVKRRLDREDSAKALDPEVVA